MLDQTCTLFSCLNDGQVNRVPQYDFLDDHDDEQVSKNIFSSYCIIKKRNRGKRKKTERKGIGIKEKTVL